MSLTSFIKEPEVRDRIDEDFPNQGQSASNPIAAEWQTNNYMLIGTAFDYLVRFWLRRNADTYSARPWIAESSLEIAFDEFPEIADEIEAIIDDAKQRRDDYLQSGTLSRPLIQAAIDLARIDGIYRGGRVPSDLGQYDDADIVDCLRLFEILDTNAVLNGENVVLNPTFGFGSHAIGGADADCILDGKLVDIKTTGYAAFKPDYWRQLVGYMTLADIHNTLYQTGMYDRYQLDEEPLPEIESFGIYFARHGEFETVPASVIYDADAYPEFRSWFVKTVFEVFDSFSPPLRQEIEMMI